MQRGKILIGILVVFGLISIGFGFDQNGNECVCYNASDCNSAIASSSCTIIKLGADIDGTLMFSGVSNKFLDCQGHSIVSITGIFFSGTNTNITINNCNISGFREGILFYETITNITISNSVIDTGIKFLTTSINNLKVLNTTLKSGKYIKVFENVNNVKIDDKSIGQLILINTSNVVVSDLSLEQTLYLLKANTNVTISSGSYGGIWLDGTNTNISIIDCNSGGIWFNYNSIYTNIIINDCNINGEINFGGTNTINVTISNCNISNGIWFYRKNTNITITNCNIGGFRVSGGLLFIYNFGIEFNIGSTNTNIIINNCNISEKIWFYGTNTNITINNCNISGSDYGIFFDEESINTNILISNCSLYGEYFGGVGTYYSTNNNITIKNSVINGKYGIYGVDNDRYNNFKIINVSFSSNEKNIFFNNSIYLNNLYISSSKFYGSEDIVFDVNKSENITITNSTFVANVSWIRNQNIQEYLKNILIENCSFYGNYSNYLMGIDLESFGNTFLKNITIKNSNFVVNNSESIFIFYFDTQNLSDIYFINSSFNLKNISWSFIFYFSSWEYENNTYLINNTFNLNNYNNYILYFDHEYLNNTYIKNNIFYVNYSKGLSFLDFAGDELYNLRVINNLFNLYNLNNWNPIINFECDYAKDVNVTKNKGYIKNSVNVYFLLDQTLSDIFVNVSNNDFTYEDGKNNYFLESESDNFENVMIKNNQIKMLENSSIIFNFDCTLNNTYLINNSLLVSPQSSYLYVDPYEQQIIFLNNSEYGNYYLKTDGTGYSQICNDTNHDGICDLPYDPINNQVITLLSNLNEPTLKLDTLKLATSYIDYKPLAIIKKITGNISYNPNTNTIVATIYSDFSGTATYNLEIEGATFNTGNINLSNGENNLSLPLEDIKFCGFQNITLKIGNNTITKQLNFGSCEVFSSGGGAYEAPENLFYIFIVLIFGIFYEIMRKDKK